MTHQERWQARLVPEVRDDEPQPFIGLVTGKEGGAYLVTVNNRPLPRRAVCTNEFSFEVAGTGEGDEVTLLATDGGDDLAQILGISGWSVHGDSVGPD